MTPEDEIKKVQEILSLVHTQKMSKLMNGMLKRRAIKDAVERGETPTGYRVEWLHESSQRVFALLRDIAIEFNNKHKDDTASAHDLVDIVQYVLYTLTKKVDE